MIQDITIGQYLPGNSIVHRLDARIKILITLLFIVLIFFIQTYLGYGIILFILIAMTAVAKIPPTYLFRGLKPLWLIILLTLFINVFFTQGEAVVFSFWRLRVTQEGLRTGAFMALRLILLVIGTSLLTLTTSPLTLTDGIEALLTPLKILRFPAHELAMMMTIALRFIPTLLEETDKIMKAQTARGADFESGNLLQRAKALIPLLVPLFISAFRRADELAMAMEARCYRGGKGRTRMNQLKLQALDLIVLFATAAGFTVVLIIGL